MSGTETLLGNHGALPSYQRANYLFIFSTDLYTQERAASIQAPWKSSHSILYRIGLAGTKIFETFGNNNNNNKKSKLNLALLNITENKLERFCFPIRLSGPLKALVAKRGMLISTLMPAKY